VSIEDLHTSCQSTLHTQHPPWRSYEDHTARSFGAGASPRLNRCATPPYSPDTYSSRLSGACPHLPTITHNQLHRRIRLNPH
jgi:hypothetical protein